MKRDRKHARRQQTIDKLLQDATAPAIRAELADTMATIRAIRGDGDPEILRLIAEDQARKKGKSDETG